MKRLIALLMASAMVFSMAACTAKDPGSADGTEPVRSELTADEILASKEFVNTYKTSFSSSYASFNYFSTAYSTVRSIVSNSVDGLVEPDKYGVYVPSLAESWETNEDRSVWTFRIRDGVHWVDHKGEDTGLEVNAQDFVDGIRYIADPKNEAYALRVVRNLIEGLYDYYWDLDDIDSGAKTDMTREAAAARFDDMVGVEALDEHTVRYTLTSGAPYFLSLIESSMLLLPVEYDYAVAQGEDFAVDNEHMLYCGGYYISSFERDKAITLTKNPHYWDASNISVERVEYQMIPEGTTSLEMFKRKEVDEVSVEAEEYLTLQNSEWAADLIPTERNLSTNYLWLDFAGENPEFNTFVQNENFRKALQYSLDREAIAALRDPIDPGRILRNTINAEGCIYDSEGVDYTDYPALKAVKDTDYGDAAKAREYMQAAVEELCGEDGSINGVQAGKVDYMPVGTYDIDGKLPVTVIYVGTDDENEIVMAQLMKSMVEEAIGPDLIEFRIECYSGWTYGTVADPLNYDIYFDSLSTGYADPSGILTRLTTDGAENVGKYEVPEYDALIEQALGAGSFEERLEYFAQAEAYLCEGAYVIPFISSLRGYYMTNRIPFTGPLTLYGNEKYKGAKVMSEALSFEEYTVLKEAYEAERAEALKAD